MSISRTFAFGLLQFGHSISPAFSSVSLATNQSDKTKCLLDKCCGIFKRNGDVINATVILHGDLLLGTRPANSSSGIES